MYKKGQISSLSLCLIELHCRLNSQPCYVICENDSIALQRERLSVVAWKRGERLDESDDQKAPCVTGTLFPAVSPFLPGEASFLLLAKPAVPLLGAVLL